MTNVQQVTQIIASMALTAALQATPAFALEDHAVLAGRFDWIVPRNVEDQYPNGELNPAKSHLVSRIQVDRQDDGLFVMLVTLPSTLTAGQTIVARYNQIETPEDEDLRFVNPAKSGDYMLCSPGTDSWVDMHCYDVHSFKQVQDVPAQTRRAYAQSRYGGTAAGTGMQVIAGAEPGGELQFLDPSVDALAPWLGVWTIEYASPNGQTVRGTMEIDGYTGIYRPATNDARGVLTNFFIDGDHLRGTWQMGSTRGYVNFAPAGDTFTGTWELDEDSSQTGFWNGHR